MSAMGHKRTLKPELTMSALPLKADMLSASIDVCLVPIADILAIGAGLCVNNDHLNWPRTAAP
jgi:hypothetical protein